MRISDWSSDVCSSDLGWHSGPVRVLGLDLGTKRIGVALSDSAGTMATPYDTVHRSGDRRRDHRRIAELAVEAEVAAVIRSDERRVGKESVRTCSTRWSPEYYKKTKT